MFHTFEYDGYVFNAVTITIGVIGVAVPILFSVFMYFILRKSTTDEAIHRKEMKQLLTKMQLDYAAENIARRRHTS